MSESLKIFVGGVPVGGGAPVSVQTMTNTDTKDAEATANQILLKNMDWTSFDVR